VKPGLKFRQGGVDETNKWRVTCWS